ncbi:unnamed protein product [Rhizoctonia solani]|uniref:Uncharacterized protein n=1 Tax=Rhizoctonia solani TaxID=456999 RepID=A0A8H3CCC6_9AGAM|nr:unnamed protein product [Rhizoctonia solani]
MGSVCSAIGRAINSVISAIANVFMAIALQVSSWLFGTSSLISSAADVAHVVAREQEDTSARGIRMKPYEKIRLDDNL